MPNESRNGIERPRLSIIIPCFNEEGAIASTVDAVGRAMKDHGTYEIIVVDDGSTDKSGKILDGLSPSVGELQVIHHNRNRGYGAALKTGILRARAEFVAITDADGTYPNERLPELTEIARDADMVVGARTGEHVTYSKIRMIPKLFLRWYSEWIAAQPIPDINSGLRVCRKPLVEKFINVLPDTFSFTTTLTLALLTNYYDVRYVPIDYAERVGKSKIKPIRDTLRFIQLIVRTGTYFAPLRVFFPVGFGLFIVFLVSLAYDIVVLRNLTDKTIIIFLFSMNTAMFALLADMIDKRTSR